MFINRILQMALETGLLIGSFHAEQSPFCLFCYLEPVLGGTEPVLNEWGCPLLTLTNMIHCIPSRLALSTVQSLLYTSVTAGVV